MSDAVALPESEQSFSELHRRIHRIYRQNYRDFLAISLPAAILSAVAISVTADKATELARSFRPALGMPPDLSVVLRIGIVRIGGLLISMFLECYAFAATVALASAVRQQETTEGLILDSYSAVRGKIGAILYFAVTTFVKSAVALSGASLVPAAFAFKFPHWWRSYLVPFQWLVFLWEGLVLSILFGRYALAIPAIVIENVTGHQAIKRTVKLVEGFDVEACLLAFESLLICYLAGQSAVIFANHLLAGAGWLSEEVAHWIIVAMVALATAIAQPPLFIGCSLIYFKGNHSASAETTAQGAS